MMLSIACSLSIILNLVFHIGSMTEILNEKARATLSNIQVSFSVGFTNLNVPKANAADIIKLADRNMYRNKTFKKQQRQALEKEQSATKK